ncbi:MAG TPA: hypothetical protein PK239_03905 [Chitinophagales bacterium]|nr:hypothetical protein [Chitinophagales bacterium]HRK26415.1 hypothetical protein [Chitinophagales bacterium]
MYAKKTISPFFALLMAAGIWFSSCTDTSTIPAYLNIPTMQLLTQSGQGSASHNIKNVWVFVNSQSLGVYELPASVPVLEEGNARITLRAGIMNNGISATRSIYPFYAADTFNIQLAPEETVSRNSLVRYSASTAFALIADFEVGNGFADTNPNLTQLTLTTNPNLVFEGNRSATLTINEVNPFFEIGTIESYTLPGNKIAVYLEMNYKCDESFLVAVKGTDISGNIAILPQLFVNRKTEWNKIYIDLTETVSNLNLQGFKNIQILFKGELPGSVTQASYFWDNIKILYLN